MNSKTTSLPADSKQRQLALSANRSFIVQAPAGSGKTTLLVQRYLTLLARVERPEQVVVITFTRKATGELRDRVIQALEHSASTAPADGHLISGLAAQVLARDAELNWNILQTPSRLGIYTIDALCAVLVRQMPWLSGLGGVMRIEDQPDQLYRRAADNVLAGLNVSTDVSEELIRVFEHLDNNLALIRDLLVRMLAQREQWMPYLQSEPEFGSESARGFELRDALQRGLAFIIEGQLSELIENLPSPIQGQLLELVVRVGEGAKREAADSNYAALATLSELPGTQANALSTWRLIAGMLLTANNNNLRKRDVKAEALTNLETEERRAINQLAKALLPELACNDVLEPCLSGIAKLPDAIFQEQEWQLLLSLLEVLKSALGELRVIFAREACVDFSEVTSAALQALGPADNPTDLGLSLDYRIQHLLVDEFQDTSRVHYQLVERLTDGFSSGDGRSLFLVGDPMQSIYRFREAEVGLFLECMQEGLAGIDLDSISLESNFRSRPALVAWVNEVFAQVFPDHHDAAQSRVAHARAEAQRDTSVDSAVTLNGLVDAPNSEQADHVAQRVCYIRQNHPQDTIAILVRSRGHLEHILPALRRAGLGYRGVDIEPLAEVSVVRDLHALTRALAQPADRMSWMAVLHAPWCGLRLADLYALLADDWQTSVPVLLDDVERHQVLDEATKLRLDIFLQALYQASDATRHARLKRRVEACWLACGGPGFCDSDQVRDAQRYFELLDALESAGGRLDLDALGRRLDGLYASAQEGEPDVDIMTMHKAKGLEFDQVILPYLEKTPRAADPPLLQWSEVAFDAGTSLVFAAKPAADGDASRYQFVSALEAHKQRNESARLLYVACTRAREQLHLFYGLKRGAKQELRSPTKSSLLAHLWPVLSAELEAHLIESEVVNSIADSQAQMTGISRLAPGWQIPLMEAVRIGSSERASEIAPEIAQEVETLASVSSASLDFDWAGESARSVGLVVHRRLRDIAEQGLGVWSAQRIRQQQPQYVRELQALGVLDGQQDDASERVVEALTNTLADERGRWLLNGDHLETSCELPLCGLIAGRVYRVYLDRSFVDAHNVRWIVDYKTGSHEGADLQGFLDAEQQRYAYQLQRYGEIMQHLDSRTIRLGLYFPLFGGWREWQFTP